MSSHQNSAFNADSVFIPRAVQRPVRSPVQPSGRIARPPDQIWGQYNNYRSNGVVLSAIIHIAVLGLLLSGIFVSHAVVERVTRQQVTLIAPSADTYALPAAKKVVSGGGGGGDHDPLPAPKGALPKTALEQITPPAIVLRNQHPRLTAEPTVVVPPQVKLASNHGPTLGVPNATAVMPSAPPSNGTGAGGGIGSGSGGGIGVGHGPGVGAGTGGGIGGGVYHVGGGISAPKAISAPDPEYTEEARRAKTQGPAFFG